MLTVGLTGGIGSGKSTVARLLEGLGAIVVDADRVARQVVEPGSPTLAALADRFGDAVVRPDGTLDRTGLAALVFPDPAALEDLNAITGPAIAERVTRLRAAVPPEAVTVYDMPLLVERRLWPYEHLTVVVAAPEAVRLERLVSARGLAEPDARHRMAAQASDEERRAAADVWIDNSGTVEQTREQVHRLWHERLVPYNANLLTRVPSQVRAGSRPVPPDPAWPAQAGRLAARVETALLDVLPAGDVAVHHVGPTSVPGLAARDILDLQLAVPRLADADASRFVAAMERCGLLRVDAVTGDETHPPPADPGGWQRRLYAAADPGRAARIHVRERGSPGAWLTLLVRDWLTAEREEREAYAAQQRRQPPAPGGAAAYAPAWDPWLVAAHPRVMAWAARSGWQPPPGVGAPST